MSRLRIFTIVVAVVFVGVLLGGVFLYYFEPVEEEIDTGYSLEARRNPFLAVQRFVNKLDIETEVIRGAGKLEKMPPESDVLIASYNHGFELNVRKDKILNWINRGGHLILELKQRESKDDAEVETPFLNELEIKGKRSNAIFSKLVYEPIDIRIYENSETLTVEFDPQFTLETTREDWVLYFEDKNGPHLIELSIGDGTLTAVSDMDLWRNRSIDKHDHAAAFAHIIGARPGKVWFLYSINMPTLFELIWNHGSETVISASILLLFALWYMNNRFGPLLKFQQQQRRSLLEHLDAVGQFDWRYNKAENLLDSARRELHQVIEKLQPQWQKKSLQQQSEWIAERTRLSEQEVLHALSSAPENQSGFTRFMKTLQTIRTKI